MRLAITKRINLGDCEGFDSECYVDLRPYTFAERTAATQNLPDDMPILEQRNEMARILKEHFIGGKVKALDDAGDVKLVDCTADDVFEQFPEDATNYIFAQLVGAQYEDPKGTPTQTETSPTNQPTTEPKASESTTEPSSSGE